jgi:phosphoribosylformylglycinamidine cyclo-ligase
MKAYAKAGVDVDLGNTVKSGIQKLVQKTMRPEVLGQVGGFGGLFSAKFPGYKDPVLVSSVDGVGTKLRVAEMMDRHDTIGEDLVNHCVNDIGVIGAEPLFFLDYIGTAQLEPARFKEILSGLARGCQKNGCALIGGETAQMPGLYHGKDYDLVGTIVGVVDRKKMLDGSNVRGGDVIIGLPSSGLHTNGYSLARELIFKKMKLKVDSKVSGIKGTIGDALLATHRSYLPELRKVRKANKLVAAAHITGGGLIDNLPRVLPSNLDAVIELGSFPIPPLFELLVIAGRLPLEEAFQVFNMGIGMCFIVRARHAEAVCKLVRGYEIGRIADGRGNVVFTGGA